MASENRCPKCGSEMVQGTRWIRDEKWGRGHEEIVPGAWVCREPENCRIIELQRESATFKATAQGLLNFQKQDRERIAELESLLRASEARERELQGKLEEAKEATRVARETNTLLREKGGLQLEYAALSRVAFDYKRERDAALAQVAVLNETIYREMVNIRIIWNKSQKRRAAHEGPCFETSVETILQALSNTCTTAQLRVEAIGREAASELMQALRDYGQHQRAIPELGVKGCDYDPEEGIPCTCGLAAILGEKGQG